MERKIIVYTSCLHCPFREEGFPRCRYFHIQDKNIPIKTIDTYNSDEVDYSKRYKGFPEWCPLEDY